MAERRTPDERGAEGRAESSDGSEAEFVAGGSQWHPMTAAALVGGAIAATAGAYLGTRALARRNASADGRKLNSVMATAITACDLAGKQSTAETEPPVAKEPTVPSEPKV
ncbi:MAG TPA: hypothetical protein VGW34_09680 [Allosphingosinicella sp.]|nr:hypothetical protein [Allosphingosinicella sp.]